MVSKYTANNVNDDMGSLILNSISPDQVSIS